jgi:hypothetical protein
MNKQEKLEQKRSKDLAKMKKLGWGIDKDYTCILASQQNRLAYGWTNPKEDLIYCPFHNRFYSESEGHFKIMGQNCKVA